MKKNWSRFQKLTVTLAVLAALGAAGVSSSKVRWRTKLVTYKLAGTLPYASWGDLVRRMSPSRTVFTSAQLVPEFRGQLGLSEEGEEPCPVKWGTPAGPFWGRREDGDVLSYILAEQLRYRVYEQGDVQIRKRDIALDVGAHLGVFTRLALREGADLVVAFEPHPVHKVCFERTFHEEIEEGRVILVTAAAWETAGELTLLSDRDNSSASSVIEERPGAAVREITIPATTIDNEVRRLNLERVDFIKMKIEGAERYALRGAHETIAKFRPRMAIAVAYDIEDLVAVPRVVTDALPDYQIHHRRLAQLYFDPGSATSGLHPVNQSLNRVPAVEQR